MRGATLAGLLLILFGSLDCPAQVEQRVAYRSSVDTVFLGEAFTLEVTIEDDSARLNQRFESLLSSELDAFSLTLKSRTRGRLGEGRVKEARVYAARCFQLGRIRLSGTGPESMQLEVRGRLDPSQPGPPENPLTVNVRAWRQGPWLWLLVGVVSLGTLLACLSLSRGARSVRRAMRGHSAPLEWPEALAEVRARWTDALRSGAVPPQAAYDLSQALRIRVESSLKSKANLVALRQQIEALSHEQLVGVANEHLFASAPDPVSERSNLLRLLKMGEASRFGREPIHVSAEGWRDLLEAAAGLSWLHEDRSSFAGSESQ